MKKKLILWFILAAGLPLLAKESKPNIIVFLVDDMGLMDTSVPFLPGPDGKPALHPLNEWYRTPSMARLASLGIRFSDFYAHTVCSPTRVSIMTGQNAARHHITNFISPERKNTGTRGAADWRWSGLTRNDVTLPRLLKQSGYRTIHVGKAHFAPVGKEGEDPRHLGFDVNIGGCAYGQPGSYYGEDGYGNLNPKRQHRAVPGLDQYHETNTFLTEALTLEAKKAIDKSLDEEQPFFLYMAHYAVHSPFQADARFQEHYSGSGKKPSANAFATLIEGMDKSLGDLLDHLDRKRVSKHTVVFFLGDNGSASPLGGNGDIGSSAPLRGKKGSQWEGGIRVPFMAAWAKPDATSSVQKKLPIQVGGFQRQLGACFDLFPTILQLADALSPDDHFVDGHSLKTLLTGSSDSGHPSTFLSHFPHPRTDHHFTTYREGVWKLIYHYFPNTEVPRYALYHLEKDPTESLNLAAENTAMVKRLTRSMAAMLKQQKALYPIQDGEDVPPVVPK